MALHTIHVFAGAGGGVLADALTGHIPICAVENEIYPRCVLLQRQLDGILPVFPVWDDVRTFRADNPETREFFALARGLRDNLVISGGFPCTDISAAGKGAGIEGKNSGLWHEMARIIGEIRPRYVFVENAPLLRTRGGTVVTGALAALGYMGRFGIISAADAGALHLRKRWWCVAERQGFPPHTELRGDGWQKQFTESVEKMAVENPERTGTGDQPLEAGLQRRVATIARASVV